MSKKKNKFPVYTGGRFIDPTNVNSHIHWSIKVDAGWNYSSKNKPKEERKGWVYIDGVISLSDCNRVIRWEFNEDYETNINKIEASIAELENFKTHLKLVQIDAEALANKYNTKLKSRNDIDSEDDEEESAD